MSPPLRWALIIVAVTVAIVVLFTVVFPWVDRALLDDPVLTSAADSRRSCCAAVKWTHT